MPAVLAGQVAQTPPEQVVDGAIYVGANPAEPRVGDLKVSDLSTPTARSAPSAARPARGLSPYQTKAGRALYIIDSGERDAAQMFQAGRERITRF